MENLDKIKPELFKIFDDIVQKKSPFNIDRLKNLIKMKISELNDKVSKTALQGQRLALSLL